MRAARSAPVRNFGRDFVQGALEDEVKERMFPGSNIMTGAPTLGGGVATILRKLVSGSAPPVLPHTNKELFGFYQTQGLSMPQAAAVMQQNAPRINTRTLQSFVSRGVITAQDMAELMRARIVAEDDNDGLTAQQLAELYKTEMGDAQSLANISAADMARGVRDRD